MRNWCSFRRG